MANVKIYTTDFCSYCDIAKHLLEKIEVAYEEVQRSPTYGSGWGLRFPRVLRLRNDKPLKEISDIDLVKRIHNSQKKK